MSTNGLIGKMEYDGLIAGLEPAAIVGAGLILGGESDTEYKRGTAFSKNDDGKLVILGTEAGEGTTLTPDCVLYEDTVVGTEDALASVYVAGCFDPEKIIVADGYELTDKDKDALRVRSIYLCDKID